MLQVLEYLLVLVVAVAVIAWVLSPLETLTWWSSRGARQSRIAAAEFRAAIASVPTVPRAAKVFVVYFSGIAAFDDDHIARAERPLLQRLQQSYPDITLVEGLYPYAMENRDLVDDRRSSPLWRWIVQHQRSKRWGWVAVATVNVRNVYQVLVSADPRYGPVYSAGIAQTTWKHLTGHGYQPGVDKLVLLGWSGGAQIAAGAAWYLGSAGARVTLLNLGGVFTADPGLDRAQQIIHLVGERDWQCRWLAPIVFPQRRRWARHSTWARAKREHRVVERVIGPFKHVGPGSYLSGARLPDGRTCSRATSDAIARALAESGVLRRAD